MSENNVQIPLNLSVSTFGEGPIVVLLHGFLEDKSMWDFLKDDSFGVQFVCVDLPGHGESDLFNDSPSIANIAYVIRHVIDHYTSGVYSIIGHSLGGYVGLELARTSNLVSNLVLLHSHPFDDSEQKKTDRDRIVKLVKSAKNTFIRTAIPNLFAFPEKHQSVISAYCEIAEKMTPEAIGWSTIAMRNRSNYALETFPNTTISIIHGQKDPIIPLQPLKDWAVANNHRWSEIPECGHMSQLEQPEHLISCIRAVLEKRL